MSSPLGRRDRAILELFYASGLRLTELVSLDVEDVNLSDAHGPGDGQGRKERLVPFNAATAASVRAWLKGDTRCGGRWSSAIAGAPTASRRARRRTRPAGVRVEPRIRCS